MTTAKIGITLEEGLLGELDALVSRHVFKNRSQAIQDAIQHQLRQHARLSLIRECEKLDSHEERVLSEEGMQMDGDQWPTY